VVIRIKCKRLTSLLIFIVFLLAACGTEPPIEGELNSDDKPVLTATEPEDRIVPKDVTGTYKLTGTNPDGSSYECMLDIRPDQDVYMWRWYECGEFYGVGIQQRDKVSVAWGGEDCRVYSYLIHDDGRLSAEWTLWGYNSLGTESAVPTEGNTQDIAGSYNVTGTSPDGGEYGGKLDITPDGDVYQWVLDLDTELVGVGVRRENVISVAYGGQNCSVVSYQVNDDGSLESLWAYVGSSDLGTENVMLDDGSQISEEAPTSDAIDLGEFASDILPAPSDGCGSSPLSEVGATEVINTRVGELERKYYLHIPPNYDSAIPTSLVLSFHGYTDRAVGMEYGTGMNTQADKYNFIIVYPESTSFSSRSGVISSWNDLSCNASPGPEGPICSENSWSYEFPPECGEPTDCNWCTCHDDLAFIEQILDDVESNLCIDRKRVYATGMSNGGMFVHRLGCDLGNRFAAIAPVAGTLARGFNCAPDNSNQVSILNIHGSLDDYVDVTGKTSSDGYLYTAVTDVMATWSADESQGCNSEVTPYSTVADGMLGMTCTQNANCDSGADVVSCWWNAAHDWPSGENQFGNEMIWEFFRKNAKRELP